MEQKRTSGPTLIELLIIVVIICLLVAVAYPKFVGQKAKASNGALRTDLRNAEHAEDSYLTQFKVYGTADQLQQANLFHASQGNTATVSVTATGYTITIAGAASGDDSLKRCTATLNTASNPAPTQDCN